MKKIIVATLLFLPTFAFANPGPYIQIFGGQNTVDTNGSWNYVLSQNTWYSRIEHSSGIAGGAGVGYLFGNNTLSAGLELDALIYPHSTSTHYTYDGNNISLFSVVKYKPFTRLGVVGLLKFGMAMVHQSFTYKNVNTWGGFVPDQSGHVEETAIAPALDLGIGYQITSRVEVDLIADTVFLSQGDNTGNGRSAAGNENALLNVSYRFA